MSIRPTRPTLIPGGNMSQGGPAWVPGVNMPPLGFGVVPQQPSTLARTSTTTSQLALSQGSALVSNWPQQQFLASQQMSMGGTPVQPFPQQSAQQQYLQQQQWMEAQRKAVEEQHKLHDQLMKQRQFDEQKMRLKAFSASKNPAVSADTMIEHILGSKDIKHRSPPLPNKWAGENTGKPSAPTAHRQGTAADWSKMERVDCLFTAYQSTVSQQVVGAPPAAAPPPHDPTPHLPPDAGDDARLPKGQPNTTFSNNPANSNTGKGNTNGTGKKREALPLPGWLSNQTCLPGVYQHAGSLVLGGDGWVDTSRAYMLLMKTGLPPNMLGVLWEMVNCTRPGQLVAREFTALLALVALVQAGQPITSAETLCQVQEPVLPIIDHPALLPLVQDYIQQRQQKQAQQDSTISESSPATTTTTTQDPTPSQDDDFADFVSVGPSSHGTRTNFFQATELQAGIIGNSQMISNLPPPLNDLEPSDAIQKPVSQALDRTKAMNLPKVGFSPDLSPTTSFDNTADDDFDDFQSAAAVTGQAPVNKTQASFPSPLAQEASMNSNQQPPFPPAENTTHTAPALLQPEKPLDAGDKYAVFRQLETPSEPARTESLPPVAGALTSEADDGFGDFCSSEPASLTTQALQTGAGSSTSNTSPISFEVYSTPPETLPETSVDCHFEADFSSAFAGITSSSTQAFSSCSDNYADIHEAMKKAEVEQQRREASGWSDPFGEFEEAPAASISQPPHIITPQVNVGVSDDDEDFGDFMGPTAASDGLSCLSVTQSVGPGQGEALGETQSVASLELPGLEMTVGLPQSEAPSSGFTQSPDLFAVPRHEMSAVEDQLGSLSLDPSAMSGEVTSNGSSGGNGRSQPAAPVMESFSSGLVDKYSIIREEGSKSIHDEAHTGSWERCLEGCLGILEQADAILASLTRPKIKAQVMQATQMKDYLANVQEVWLVCDRIATSSQQVTSSARVDQLLSQARQLWTQIKAAAHNAITKADTGEGDNQMGPGEVCGVCLAGGGAKLTYSGHSYHPSCANLWLNCVDLLLPSLTPVTLL